MHVLTEEALEPACGARVLEHALGCAADACVGDQGARVGVGQERLVRRGAPEKVRQTAGHLVAGVAAELRAVGRGLADLDAEQEVRRLEDGRGRELEASPRIGQARGDGRCQLDEAGDFGGVGRATPGSPREASEVLGVALRARRTADERLTARGVAEHMAGHQTGGGLVLLDGQRREGELAAADGGEAMQRRVDFDVGGHRRALGHQVAEGRQVLRARQAMEGRRRRVEGRRLDFFRIGRIEGIRAIGVGDLPGAGRDREKTEDGDERPHMLSRCNLRACRFVAH